MAQFIAENTAWSLAHPEEAAKIREQKIAAEENGLPNGEQTTAEGSTADAVKAAEGGDQPKAEDAKPAEGAPVAGATPAKLDEWAAKAPELKAAFEKYPELHAEIMETARFAETMKEVSDIVSTKEEAQLLVERFWAGALRRAVIEGDIETGSVMAGQSVGMVTSVQPVAEIIQELVGQAVAALAGRGAG